MCLYPQALLLLATVNMITRLGTIIVSVITLEARLFLEVILELDQLGLKGKTLMEHIAEEIVAEIITREIIVQDIITTLVLGEPVMEPGR